MAFTSSFSALGSGYSELLHRFSYAFKLMFESKDESDDFDQDNRPTTAPPFSGRYKGKCEIHTHASVNNLLYNLGFVAFIGDDPNNLVSTPLCASHCLSFKKPDVRKAVKLTIKVPGRKAQT